MRGWDGMRTESCLQIENCLTEYEFIAMMNQFYLIPVASIIIISYNKPRTAIHLFLIDVDFVGNVHEINFVLVEDSCDRASSPITWYSAVDACKRYLYGIGAC